MDEFIVFEGLPSYGLYVSMEYNIIYPLQKDVLRTSLLRWGVTLLLGGVCMLDLVVAPISTMTYVKLWLFGVV